MSSVFHYTDSAGLLGILKSKSLYATDYRYLNDVSEGSMIRDLIVPLFVQDISSLWQTCTQLLHSRTHDNTEEISLKHSAVVT
jgi:hypothetical protein